jgi:Uncharacterized conserved protein
MILLKRAYEKADKTDGRRVLIDRLWPRGVAKTILKLDEWNKEVAPSTELRVWFDHDPRKWKEFTKRYKAELRSHKDALHALKKSAKRLTLVYADRDTEHTHALVLKEVLENTK